LPLTTSAHVSVRLALAAALLIAHGCGERPAPVEAPPVVEEPALAPTVAEEPAPAPRARGLWVLCEGSQRVLENPDRLELLLEDARGLGVTDLFVQVYRGGRAWFDSTLADPEPYASTWRARDDVNSDALSTLIAHAHAQGLRVHAWVNVLSLASNGDAPILQDLGPAAAAVDQKGRSILDYPGFEVPEPDRRYYRMGTPALWLDPAAPGVAARLAATFAELVERYPALDGLHLDYIRYPDALPFPPATRFGVGLSFGFGEASRARFEAETGLRAPFGPSIGNGDRWDDWRRSQLTQLVRSIVGAARLMRPEVTVSAAVLADVERAFLVDFQDWLGWLDEGLLDFAVPMLYTRDQRLLRYGVEEFSGLAADRAIWVGLGSWLFSASPERAVEQLRKVAEHERLGSALFSWDSIRESVELREALVAEVSGE
jgi:uncharacterized lipoprotein YddW (UPF0748 family)